MFGKNKTNNANAGKDTKPKKRNPAVLFVRTFLITTLVLIVLIFSGGLIFIANWISPPDITDRHTDADGYYENGEWHEVAFTPPEMNEADRNVGSLNNRLNLDYGDRKPDFYTFLIFGLDYFGANTDTIMVASYDGVAKEANIIAFPRDTLVNVQRRIKRINAAYGAGTLNGGGHDGGVDQFRREISTLIGFEPDYYICIDLKAFERIIDAVGGIDIYNPYNMVYSDPEQNLYINIPKGQHHLMGSEAIKFARFRQWQDGSGIGDIKRIENQQTVINAVLERLLRPQTLLKIPEFIQIFNETVRSDLGLDKMGWLAYQLMEVRGTDALSMYTVNTTGGMRNGSWYEILDPAETISLVNDTINPYLTDIPPEYFDIITSLP